MNFIFGEGRHIHFLDIAINPDNWRLTGAYMQVRSALFICKGKNFTNIHSSSFLFMPNLTKMCKLSLLTLTNDNYMKEQIKNGTSRNLNSVFLIYHQLLHFLF